MKCACKTQKCGAIFPGRWQSPWKPGPSELWLTFKARMRLFLETIYHLLTMKSNSALPLRKWNTYTTPRNGWRITQIEYYLGGLCSQGHFTPLWSRLNKPDPQADPPRIPKDWKLQKGSSDQTSQPGNGMQTTLHLCHPAKGWCCIWEQFPQEFRGKWYLAFYVWGSQ